MRTVLLVVGILFSIGWAQAQEETCAPFVEETLLSVAEVCTEMESDTVCYGTSLVERVTVVQPTPPEFFAAPGDQEVLSAFREVLPQPLNAESQSFGTALMNVQATIPESLPGHAVLFLLMGDVRFIHDTQAEGYQDSPFQAFYFLPGIGPAPCYEAEPLLTIQTPGNMTITISLNGVETDMSPGTLLTITPDVCTIHRGSIIQYVGDGTDVLVANQTVDIHIDEQGAVIVDNLRGISEREFERGALVQQAMNRIAFSNGWSEQFVTMPRAFDEEPPPGSLDQEPQATPAASGSASCDVRHTILRGETLYGIARRYDTSISRIMQANGLPNPRQIFAGRTLCIPAVGSGFEGLPSVPFPTVEFP